MFTRQALSVFAGYTANGQPRQIVPGESQVWGMELQDAVKALSNVSGTTFSVDTKAELDADLAYGEGVIALVWQDDDSDNDGYWRKVGSSGSGSWVWRAPLPSGIIWGVDSGAGTANAIQVITRGRVSGYALIGFRLFEDTTSEPATVAFNGGAAFTIRTNQGTNASALSGGMWIFGIIDEDDDSFRLLIDENISDLVAQAEAARDAAVEAAESVADGLDNRVRYDISENRTEEEKEQARANIDAASEAQGALAITAIQPSGFAWPLDRFGTPAVGNDYTLLFEAAINNGETSIIPPREVGISGPIVVDTGTKITAANPYRSIVKLLDGSNCNIFESKDAATYFANPPSSGSPATVPHHISIGGFHVNGNRGNNTSGHLFYLFCRHHFIENIWAWNIPQCGFKIKYNDNGSGSTDPGASGMLGMESMLRNIWLDFVGEHGLAVEGVHDSFYENIHVIRASLKADNTYDGVRLLAGFTGRLRNIHVYNNGIVNNHRYGLYDETGSEVTSSHFEGAATANMVIAGQRGYYEEFYAYANRNSTRNIIILGNENTVRGRLGPKATSGDPDIVGVTLGLSSGDYPQGNIIDLQVIEQNAGSIDWTYSKGDNKVTLRGEQSTGPKQLGTRQATDEIDGVVSGFEFGGANNVAAAGTTQAGAMLLTEKNNRVTTVAAGAGVMLPPSASFIGEFIVVTNVTTNPLLVYVNTSDATGFFDFGPGQSPTTITIPAGRTAAFTASINGAVSPIISDANFASLSHVPFFEPSTGSISGYTVNLAKYSRVGKLVHVYYDISITNNGSGAGGIVLGLPFAVASGAGCILAGRETGSTGKQLQAYGGASATTVTVTAYDNTYPAGSGYRLILSGTYEAA
ncbi:hypothetical protein ACQZ61_04055 [Agrobacterium vitis]|uniref:hypothetical protein n=1 Tax=Agrobacterium vitis TaxID=373 RepID=UPI001F3EEEB3|nr:hypothetical protein [Agrobacterium vitis]MCF1452303.1 hypothetical protein [Agrobacterium vitis]